LEVCINGNGELADKLGITQDSVQDLDDIKSAQSNINDAKNEFQNKLTMVTYSNIKRELEERRDFKTSFFSLVDDDAGSTPSTLNLEYYLGILLNIR
jgi:hypothetical protein